MDKNILTIAFNKKYYILDHIINLEKLKLLLICLEHIMGFFALIICMNNTYNLFSEWAMKHKDWGHALFLASKMDSRTHNNVMLRFANGLQNNDPLQTLYQLMSGREPQAATVKNTNSY